MKAVRATKVRTMRVKKLSKNTVTISKQEYEGLKETIHLLSNPVTARRLRSALAQAKAGKLKEYDL